MGAVYAHPPVELPAAAVTKSLLEEAGWTNVALALEPGAVALERWLKGEEGRRGVKGPLSVWVGNEFQGLAPADRSVCRRALEVPMAEGHDSLNVAVAAGIAFYRLL
jgi:tRNA G18 (ribose-2'-O)-methylase SpoU